MATQATVNYSCKTLAAQAVILEKLATRRKLTVDYAMHNDDGTMVITSVSVTLELGVRVTARGNGAPLVEMDKMKMTHRQVADVVMEMQRASYFAQELALAAL
jgi:hypothetical protein